MAVEETFLGIERCRNRKRIQRHAHDRAYAALVVRGGYFEAGDCGRRRVSEGDVLIHGRFEWHQNEFDDRGADILNLPCRPDASGLSGRVRNPDFIVRLAERDPFEAMAAVWEQLSPGPRAADDWPDRLARALDQDTVPSLAQWAEFAGLRPASVSRGFALAFGVSPQRFRADRRASRAVVMIETSQEPLSSIAAELGFSDQAHMSREVGRLTGAPPTRWRLGYANYVQDEGPRPR
jgi:AraC-like DNA-binding protein